MTLWGRLCNCGGVYCGIDGLRDDRPSQPQYPQEPREGDVGHYVGLLVCRRRYKKTRLTISNKLQATSPRSTVSLPRDHRSQFLGNRESHRAKPFGLRRALSLCVLPRFQGSFNVRQFASVICGFALIWNDLRRGGRRFASAAHLE